MTKEEYERWLHQPITAEDLRTGKPKFTGDEDDHYLDFADRTRIWSAKKESEIK